MMSTVFQNFCFLLCHKSKLTYQQRTLHSCKKLNDSNLRLEVYSQNFIKHGKSEAVEKSRALT